jgi:putative ABC transport system substrate-binding protein
MALSFCLPPFQFNANWVPLKRCVPRTGGAFLLSQIELLTALTLRHAVPSISQDRDLTVAGGLMSYGGDLAESYRLTGVYAGRILKGEKPGDLPVQFPTEFELVINVKTAKALGLTIPERLLATADQVIE